MLTRADVERYLENWQDEIESAYLYRSLFKAEPQPALAEVYRKLAATEESRAQFWVHKLQQAGISIPQRNGWRTRALAWLTKRFGAQFVLPTIEPETLIASIVRTIIN